MAIANKYDICVSYVYVDKKYYISVYQSLFFHHYLYRLANTFIKRRKSEWKKVNYDKHILIDYCTIDSSEDKFAHSLLKKVINSFR